MYFQSYDSPMTHKIINVLKNLLRKCIFYMLAHFRMLLLNDVDLKMFRLFFLKNYFKMLKNEKSQDSCMIYDCMTSINSKLSVFKTINS